MSCCPAFVLTAAKISILSTSARTPLRVCTRPVARRVSAAKSRSLNMSLLPFIPNWLVLGGWVLGAYRFYLGFNRTSYQSSFRIPLALAWPLLFVVNSSYRQNFIRSIKAADDD